MLLSFFCLPFGLRSASEHTKAYASSSELRSADSVAIWTDSPAVFASRIRKPSFEGDVMLCAEIRLGRFCLRHSAVILDRLLDAGCGFLQVFEVHSRMELDVCIEG
jgi:hypothetical protein